MIKLDFHKAQELIFEDDQAKSLFPEFKDIFYQWKLGKIAPSLRPTAQKAVLDFLNKINVNHLEMLSSYFKEEVIVEKLDNFLIKTVEFKINEDVDLSGLMGELFAYRSEDKIYIGAWR